MQQSGEEHVPGFTLSPPGASGVLVHMPVCLNVLCLHQQSGTEMSTCLWGGGALLTHQWKAQRGPQRVWPDVSFEIKITGMESNSQFCCFLPMGPWTSDLTSVSCLVTWT